MTDSEFEVSKGDRHGIPVLTVRGEVDVSTAPELREQLLDLADSGHAMTVVDMTDVSFVDSTALGVLVSALKRFRSNGGDMRLVITQPHVAKVFDITGLTEVFHVSTTLDSAVSP